MSMSVSRLVVLPVDGSLARFEARWIPPRLTARRHGAKGRGNKKPGASAGRS
jgi:hypothetical protein